MREELERVTVKINCGEFYGIKEGEEKDKRCYNEITGKDTIVHIKSNQA